MGWLEICLAILAIPLSILLCGVFGYYGTFWGIQLILAIADKLEEM